MNMVVRNRSRLWSLVAAVISVQIGSGYGWAAGQAAKSDEAQPVQESVKVEPYTGPPIYLDEKEVVAAPTVMRHQTLKENFKGSEQIRVERQVAVFTDDHFEADGDYREYHPNGKLFAEGKFKSGRQDGEWSFWFDNGQLNRKANYKEGKPDGKWDVYRADGTLAAKRSFKNGVRDGDWTTYDATGKQPLSEEHYVDGKEDGEWKTWYPNGKLKQQVGYKLGQRHGKWSAWDENGKQRSEMNYVDGKLSGTATAWLPDGTKIIQEYKDNRLVSESKQ
jgi:antitoxin component YwqK of YwqJK toxin-antitoxin module